MVPASAMVAAPRVLALMKRTDLCTCAGKRWGRTQAWRGGRGSEWHAARAAARQIHACRLRSSVNTKIRSCERRRSSTCRG